MHRFEKLIILFSLISIDDPSAEGQADDALDASACETKRSDSLENLFADVGQDLPPSAELASLSLEQNKDGSDPTLFNGA